MTRKTSVATMPEGTEAVARVGVPGGGVEPPSEDPKSSSADAGAVPGGAEGVRTSSASCPQTPIFPLQNHTQNVAVGTGWCFRHGRRDFDGLHPWAKRMYSKAQQNAVARDIDFRLSGNDFIAILRASDGMCALTGIRFDFSPYPGASRRPFRPSLDRIDSSDGYHIGNCRLVCTAVNYAMSDWGLDPLLRIARALVEREDARRVTLNDLPVSVGQWGSRVRVHLRGGRIYVSYRVRGRDQTKALGHDDIDKAMRVAEALSADVLKLNRKGAYA